MYKLEDKPEIDVESSSMMFLDDKRNELPLNNIDSYSRPLESSMSISNRVSYNGYEENKDNEDASHGSQIIS